MASRLASTCQFLTPEPKNAVVAGGLSVVGLPARTDMMCDSATRPTQQSQQTNRRERHAWIDASAGSALTGLAPTRS